MFVYWVQGCSHFSIPSQTSLLKADSSLLLIIIVVSFVNFISLMRESLDVYSSVYKEHKGGESTQPSVAPAVDSFPQTWFWHKSLKCPSQSTLSYRRSRSSIICKHPSSQRWRVRSDRHQVEKMIAEYFDLQSDCKSLNWFASWREGVTYTTI